jgi:hypothetical protein
MLEIDEIEPNPYEGPHECAGTKEILDVRQVLSSLVVDVSHYELWMSATTRGKTVSPIF